MGQLLYERPREKLRNRGAASLSLAELLQLVIGPGNSQLSGARLARAVEQTLVEKAVSYKTLVALPGMGEAKACQVLAAFELGKRLRHRE